MKKFYIKAYKEAGKSIDKINKKCNTKIKAYNDIKKKLQAANNNILQKVIKESFGKRLQEIREENNFTQKEVAEYLTVAQSTYANWEQGRTEPSIYFLIMILHAYKIDFEEFFNFLPESS